MAVANFIPTIWSAKLLTRLRKSLVFGNVVNTDYSGEVSAFGDTVKINEVGPITVATHTRDAAITWATLDGTAKYLTIDQQKDWNFMLDDLDAAQVKPKLMDGAMSEAAYAMANTSDQFVAGLYASAGVTGSATYIGSAGSSLTQSSPTILRTLSYVKRYLDEANCPAEGRWGIVPPWFAQKVQAAVGGLFAATAVPKTFDNGVLSTGWIGKVAGIDLYMSNNVSTNATQYRCMFGTRQAISFVSQVAKVEAFRLQDYYADGVRGLYLYGAKVVQPDCLCTVYVAEGAA
jgi:N4-gp56 family major capsid protein